MHLSQPEHTITRYNLTTAFRKQNRKVLFQDNRSKMLPIDPCCGQGQMEVEGGGQIRKIKVVDQKYRQLIEQLEKSQVLGQQIDELCDNLDSQDVQVRVKAAYGLKQLLRTDHSEPYLQRIVDQGAIPKLLTLMKDRQHPQLQHDACQIATNIAYGNKSQCQQLIIKDGLGAFMQLLYENSGPILEQALWGLGNIAGDCVNCRNVVTKKGGFQCVIRIMNNTSSDLVMELGAWVLTNLCGGEPLPNYQIVKSALPVLGKQIVQDALKGQVLRAALWALCNHSQGKKSKIRYLLKIQNILPKLVQFCYSQDNQLLTPALRTLGNISTGSETQCNQLFNNNILALLLRLTGHEKRSIRRETCWILSNLCAGPLDHIQKCIFYPELFTKLTELLVWDEIDVKREIVYVFVNMCHLGNPEELQKTILDHNLLEPIVELFRQREELKLLVPLLKCIYQLLGVGSKLGEGENIMLIRLRQHKGFLDRLETLQYNQDTQVYEEVAKIIQRFVPTEQEAL